MDPDYDLSIQTFSAIWPRFESHGYQNLTEAERVIFCVWQFVCEVNNGGVIQYFSNPSGEYATETIDCLERIQMPMAASQLRSALAHFLKQQLAKDHALRFDQVRRLPDRIQNDYFDQLTSSFFDSNEDPYSKMADYIRQRAFQFARATDL